jgi:hypothetical protein
MSTKQVICFRIVKDSRERQEGAQAAPAARYNGRLRPNQCGCALREASHAAP